MTFVYIYSLAGYPIVGLIDITSCFPCNKKDLGENEINVCQHFEIAKKALNSI